MSFWYMILFWAFISSSTYLLAENCGNMFAIRVLLLLSLMVIDSSIELQSNSKCYFINHETKEYWKMVWQDNFDSVDYLSQNWITNDENRKCSEWNHQLSCNAPENIQLQEGCLVMSAKQAKHAPMNLTGAMITTNRNFTYGRFETRVAMSLDTAVWSDFYTYSLNLVKNGRLYMHLFENVFGSSYKVLFTNRSDDFVWKINKYDIDYSAFHLYGTEWSQSEIKFFVDDHYSEPIQLSDDKTIKSAQQIRFWIGALNHTGSVPDQPNWNCSITAVDYVRVYEKELNPKFGLNVQLCKDQNDVDESSKQQKQFMANLIGSVCVQKSLNSNTTTNNATTSNQSSIDRDSSFKVNFVYLIFGVSTLGLIGFVGRLYYRINKMPKSPQISNASKEFELQNLDYETINYDDIR